MLELQKLYNHLEYEYNEDLDYIDDIYNYLHISRLLQENEDEKTIMEKMELLDEGLFVKLKYDDITISSLARLLEKYNKEKYKLECNINKFLKQFDISLEDLILIQSDISKAKLAHDEKTLNLLNHKLDKWWSWISNKVINFIINFKQGDTSENISKILVCKKIFKLLNLYNKINNIKGFSDTKTNQFLLHLDEFKRFLKELKLDTHNLRKYNKKVKNNKNVVLTGFRDTSLTKILDKRDIDISNDINDNTIFVVTKDINKKSNKIEKAKKKNIKILSLEQFLNYIKNE